MKSQLIPLAIFQIAALTGALGQLLYKIGISSDRLGAASRRLFIGFGMMLYIGVTGLFVLAYRLGGEVSILYPTYGTTFVWGLIPARYVSHEQITQGKVLGTLLVLGGICLVTQ